MIFDPIGKILGKKLISDKSSRDYGTMGLNLNEGWLEQKQINKPTKLNEGWGTSWGMDNTGNWIQSKPISQPIQKPKPNMANPAAVLANRLNLPYKIVTNRDGSQNGIVTTKDGRQVDEWAFYRQYNASIKPVGYTNSGKNVSGRIMPVLPKPQPVTVKPLTNGSKSGKNIIGPKLYKTK